MARKINKHDISLALAVPTDGDDFLHGSNKVLTPDALDGGLGNDTLKSYIGADALTGGAGSDTFIFDWYDSNTGADFGVDTIMDFEAVDFIDLSHATYYSEMDLLVATTRALTMDDITITSDSIHVEISTGDIDIAYLGATPTADNFIF